MEFNRLLKKKKKTQHHGGAVYLGIEPMTGVLLCRTSWRLYYETDHMLECIFYKNFKNASRGQNGQLGSGLSLLCATLLLGNISLRWSMSVSTYTDKAAEKITDSMLWQRLTAFSAREISSACEERSQIASSYFIADLGLFNEKSFHCRTLWLIKR